MATSHPTASRLERFMHGELAAPDNRFVIRHLAAGCTECGEITRQLWEQLITGRRAEIAPQEDYDRAFDRALEAAQRTQQHLERERREASELCLELVSMAPQQQRLLVENNPRYQTLSLCEAVIAASEASVFDDPEKARNLAELAQETARQLDRGTYGSATVADLRAHCWASYANALRVSSDYSAAETALRRARVELDEGSGDPSQKAKYLTALAGLLTSKSRTDEALAIYKELEAIYDKLGDRHMIGRVQLKKAYVFAKKRDSEKELQYLASAMKMLDPARDPRRQAVALHNFVMALIDSGRIEEAEAQMDTLRDMHQRQGGSLMLLRLGWLEGRLAYAKGELDAAERLFTETRDAFIELEIGVDVATISLDLAEVRLQRGNFRAARELLAEAVPILEALGVTTAALAAMSSLQEAVRLETVNTELVRKTAAFVRRAQADPAVRFHPAELASS